MSQQLWAQRVELLAGRGSVAVTCIIVREIGAPSGTKPVEWRLLSNRHAASRNDVIELIDWYRARWEIEMLFDILKNACRIEERNCRKWIGWSAPLPCISWRLGALRT